MSKVPANVKIARAQGTQAGFDSWFENLSNVTGHGRKGLPQVQKLYKGVTRAGKYSRTNDEFANPEKALAYYCNHISKTFPDVADLPEVIEQPRAKRQTRTTRKPTTTETTTPDTNALLTALQALGLDVSALMGAQDTDDEDDDEGIEVEATPTHRTRRQAAAAQAQETAPAYPAPRDPDANATQGKLWKLNELGLLAILDEPDEPITAGEAYDAIGEALGN